MVTQYMMRTVMASALAAWSVGALAQSGGSVQALSLQQAIDYALEHQPDVLNAAIDRQIARQKVREITGLGLPQVQASFDVQRFMDIPTTFVPAEFFDGEAGEYAPVKFGQPYTATGGFTASQLLFDGTYLVGLQASRTYEDLSRKGLRKTKIETAVAVTKAYYFVLVSRQQLALLEANLDRVRKLYEDTKAMFKNGFIEKIEFARIELTYNKLLVDHDNAVKSLVLGTERLKYVMGMKPADELELTDTLDGIDIGSEVPAESAVVFGNRVEYSMLETSRRLYALDLKKYRFQRLPSLMAYGSFTYNASRNEFNIFSQDERWYPTSIIGARVSMPLFDGFQKSARIRQAKLNLQKLDNQKVQLEQGISLEARSARTRLVNAIATLETQRKNKDLAEEIVRVSKVKYDQGVGSNLEVVDAETDLREAQTNYFLALYEALSARTDFDQATGALIKESDK